jgi:hypothetical protein
MSGEEETKAEALGEAAAAASEQEQAENNETTLAETREDAAAGADIGHPAQSTTPSRYPYPPEGYYPPGYPPPPGAGEGSAAAAYPPRDGYGGAPPYGVPPHMGGYPMYPYHQPPMYPHYPGYPPPPMYGYPPPGEGYPGEGQGAAAGPYPPQSEQDGNGEEDKKAGAHNPVMPSALGSAARLKTYIKPRLPSSQDVLDRRSRKNAQSRSRASKLRDRISVVETKQSLERSDEEKQIFSQYEARRQRKNDRSRERALEKKEEIDRILAKPEKKRTKIEKQFLDGALGAKKRKNEGDRLRRQRLKELGLPSKVTGLKPGISARGPLGGYRGMPPPHGYPGQMGEIPMSPMPPMGGHHHHHHPMQSPGGYAGGSPGGMMPNMGFPSPQHARRPEAAGPGVLETPGRQAASHGGGGSQLPYIPPSQAYDSQAQGSRVEQRRHPDGSLSISIGGGEAGAAAYGGETGEQGGEISDLLLYNDNEAGGGNHKDI